MAIEIVSDVTAEKVEYAYGLCQNWQAEGRQAFADIGYRAALARDQKMLKIMERAAEILEKMGEEQRGQTRRASMNYGDRAELTEVALWREAYRLMDQGNPIRNLEWIYAAGAWLSGYILR